MKTNREEKLVVRLTKLSHDLKTVRKELHACKQKNRDLEKSRSMYKAKLKYQEQLTDSLTGEIKKKTSIVCFPNRQSSVTSIRMAWLVSVFH